jgi:class 3 adenylate cyclase
MNDLGKWLDKLGLSDYAGVFAENAIDEEVLPDLTDADLKELGIPLGHRKKLLKAILGLDADNSAIAAFPGSASSSSAPAVDVKGSAERRQLSVMFCDLVGSTALSERLDLEAYRDLLSAYQNAARGAIERYDGYIARYMGDGLLVYFGYPTAHEDDAERAVRAGLDLVASVSALDTNPDIELQVRVGIATGQVVAGDIVGEGASEERAVLGETPNLAARLQGISLPNCVVLSEATQHLVKGRFDLEVLATQSVKGLKKPVRAFVAKGVRAASRFDAATTSGLASFVGRQSELQLLNDRWAQAKDGEGQVVLLSGEAGIGKSRILREFRDRLSKESHIALLYQCSPYAAQTAFSPVIEQLQYAARFTSHDSAEQKLDKLERLLSEAVEDISEAAPLLAALLSLPGERYPPLSMSPQRQKLETIAALVAQLEGLALQRPVLVLVEDVHWVDPSTLETFDAVVERTQTLPVLVVMTHRPEFESAWGRFGHVTQFSLNRLKRGDGKTLSEQVTGGKALPQAVLDQILERTDGVPLFIEELTKTVLEAGLLKEENRRYTLDGPLPPLAIPSTLQDSLMARLDRLAPMKVVAQAAACIGREFSTELLLKVLERASLEDELNQLMDAGLIFRRGIGETGSYIFKHALVQDAAYESLLIAKRQQLHAQIAQTLETSPDPDPAVLAHHFSAAGLAEKAATFCLAAGRRALSVSALPEAGGELEMGLREIDAMPPSAGRDRLELDLRTALGAAKIAYFGWPHPSVSAAYEPAVPLAEKLNDQKALGPVLWGLCVHYWCRGEFSPTHQWLTKLEKVADHSKDSELPVVRGMTAGCQYFWEAEYERAFCYTIHIHEIYDERRHAAIAAYTNHDPLCFSLHWAGSLLQWIIGYPDRALEMAEEAYALAHRIKHPFNTAFALTAGQEALLMRGDTERVLECCDEVQRIVDEEGLGDFAQHVLVNNWRGRAHTRMGDYETGYRLTHLATTRWREAWAARARQSSSSTRRLPIVAIPATATWSRRWYASKRS